MLYSRLVQILIASSTSILVNSKLTSTLPRQSLLSWYTTSSVKVKESSTVNSLYVAVNLLYAISLYAKTFARVQLGAPMAEM